MGGRSKLARLLNVVLVIAVTACLEPYPAPDDGMDLDLLVVDGFVNATDGSAKVRLTRPARLSNDDGYPFEQGATVTIKAEDGAVVELIGQDSGRYIVSGLSIDPLARYQLQVTTADGQQYISDFITITDTPPIDSLSWRPHDDGLEVLATTHDDTGNSRYYRWDFVETWEYHAPFLSGYKAENGTAIYREPDEFLFECYRTYASTDILVASTARLQEDVVSNFPLIFIPRVSDRISVLYHINVQQRVILEEEYEFWEDLRRITETVGGLFDSQPYEVVGNVQHASDPGKPVLGYFSGGRVTHKQMFIDYHELTLELKKRPFHGCSLDTICVRMGPAYRCTMDLTTIPTKTYLIGTLSESGVVWGFTVASEPCSDCRKQGGVLKKPDFWP